MTDNHPGMLYSEINGPSLHKPLFFVQGCQGVTRLIASLWPPGGALRPQLNLEGAQCPGTPGCLAQQLSVDVEPLPDPNQGPSPGLCTEYSFGALTTDAVL